MTPEFFTQLATEGYNRIPILREVLADLDTPLSAYLKLAKGPYSYLLESVQGGEKWGRYSIIGLPAQTVIKVYGEVIQVTQVGKLTESISTTDPFRWLADFQQQFLVPKLPDLPRFTGGLVGYFGYDTVRYIEPRLRAANPHDLLDTPDILLMVSDQVIVFDNLNGKLYLIVHANPAIPHALEQAQQHLDQLVSQLRAPIPPSASSS